MHHGILGGGQKLRHSLPGGLATELRGQRLLVGHTGRRSGLPCGAELTQPVQFQQLLSPQEGLGWVAGYYYWVAACFWDSGVQLAPVVPWKAVFIDVPNLRAQGCREAGRVVAARGQTRDVSCSPQGGL